MIKRNAVQKNNIVNGLQQGTVNFPILFNLFIHDLLNKIDNIIGFAGDIIIYLSDNNDN